MDIDSLTVKEIKKMGFHPLLPRPKNNANGPDLTATKGSYAYSFELKKARKTRRNSLQVPPIELARKKDDFIAVLLPSGYVLIEPMKDHLKLCTARGYRTLVGME